MRTERGLSFSNWIAHLDKLAEVGHANSWSNIKIEQPTLAAHFRPI